MDIAAGRFSDRVSSMDEEEDADRLVSGSTLHCKVAQSCCLFPMREAN
jgi:hypothetical protein